MIRIKHSLFLFFSLSLVLSFYSTNAESQPLPQTHKTSYFKKFSANAEQNGNNTLLAKINYYKSAQKYFTERQRPLRHYLDLGIAVTLIESFYPFETTAYPFTAYINYRREKWGNTKITVIFSFHYESIFNQYYKKRIHTLVGVRYPTSHDLSRFHVEFLAGLSFPLNFSFKAEKLALEMRLLFTHIIGPKAGAHRLYLQWGAKAHLKQQFRSGLVVHLGLDNHL